MASNLLARGQTGAFAARVVGHVFLWGSGWLHMRTKQISVFWGAICAKCPGSDLSQLPPCRVIQTAPIGRNRSSRAARSHWSSQHGHRSSYEASTMYHGVQGMQDFGPGRELPEDSSDMEHQLFWSTCRPKQVKYAQVVVGMTVQI